MSVLLQTDSTRAAVWAERFATLAPEFELRLWPDIGDPLAVEYLVAWRLTPELLASLPNLKVLFSSGAGVDQLDLSLIPPHVQLVRMVEPGIVAGMIEYVTMAVLSLHRNAYGYVREQAASRWTPGPLVLASERTVGVMGLGVLGTAVLGHLATFGFALRGWSRSAKTLQGVDCFSGVESLDAFLNRCDILVCLLPLTPETRGILSVQLFAKLPNGAALINVARGGHLDHDALLAALQSGQLSHAVLDVVDPEPLPAEHPFWHHPRVTLTPHVASMTRPDTAAMVVIENLRRVARGDGLEDLVDRTVGY